MKTIKKERGTVDIRKLRIGDRVRFITWTPKRGVVSGVRRVTGKGDIYITVTKFNGMVNYSIMSHEIREVLP